MIAKNDITGDKIISKSNAKSYRDNWGAIFSSTKNKLERPATAKRIQMTELLDNHTSNYCEGD